MASATELELAYRLGCTRGMVAAAVAVIALRLNGNQKEAAQRFQQYVAERPSLRAPLNLAQIAREVTGEYSR